MSCLLKAAKTVDVEVIVVDNNSSEDIYSFIQTDFSSFTFISNEENLGFAKANNIGLKKAKSDKILILNPDTIVSEDLISRAIAILDEDEDIGAVSPQMLDGMGDFLPESIRSFPNFKSSFLKLLGLNKLTNYYKGLSAYNRIDVMPGACMFFKKSVFESIGGFDERYFMYGEDIDLSYQLKNKGFSALYIEELPIIHFKGKSSIKSNWSYQRSFYNAMKLYWQKNIRKKDNALSALLINLTLFVLKIGSFLKHSIGLVRFPLLDFIGIYLSTLVLSFLWLEEKFQLICIQPSKFNAFVIPVYTFMAVFSFFISKLYINHLDISKLVKGVVLNFSFILLIYFILPTEYKYSRAILVGFGAISFFIPFFIRLIYSKLKGRSMRFTNSELISIDGDEESEEFSMLRQTIEKNSHYRLVATKNLKADRILNIEKYSNSDIISAIKNTEKLNSLWLFSPSANYLIQCHGVDSKGYIIAPTENYIIYEGINRFLKRLFDVFASLIILPLAIISRHRFAFLLKSAYKVFTGEATWIYPKSSDSRVAIFRLNESLAEYYKRNYSLRLDIYYFYKFMFISEAIDSQ